MTGVAVRTATAADAAAVAQLGRTAFLLAHEGILDGAILQAVVEQTYTVHAVKQCIQVCGADEAAHFLVAESDGAVVGYLHYDSAGAEPELHRLYVAPTLIGGGVGAALLDELHRRLPARSSYILMTAEANQRAVEFYRRRGFTVDARVEGLDFYREHMGVEFPEDAAPVPCLVLRQTLPA